MVSVPSVSAVTVNAMCPNPPGSKVTGSGSACMIVNTLAFLLIVIVRERGQAVHGFGSRLLSRVLTAGEQPAHKVSTPAAE